MKRNLLNKLIFLVAFYCGCLNAYSQRDLYDPKNSETVSPGKYTLNDIQGLWSCRGMETRQSMNFSGEFPTYTVFFNMSIYIDGDSLWTCCFPCEIYEGYQISLMNDSIFDNGTKQLIGHVSSDTSQFYFFDGEPFVISLWGYAYRDDSTGTFDMQKWIRDTLNYESLTHTLTLNTDLNEPGNADPIVFPVDMPEELKIETEEEARLVCQTREVYLRIDGRKRKFIVESIDWENEKMGNVVSHNTDEAFYNPYWTCYPIIRLKPADWWKGETFFADYE